MPIYSLPGFYEPFSAILHLAAAVVFALLGVREVRRHRGDPRRAGLIGGFTIASVFMLSMSGVYHMMIDGTMAWTVMYRIDVASIFVLIAGTFTAIHALHFEGLKRWAGLTLVWAIATTGLTLMVIFMEQIPGLWRTLILAILGWATALSLLAIWRTRGWRHVRYVVYGGVAYTVGAVMLETWWPTPIAGVVGPHEMWHIAVLVGLGFHWLFVIDCCEVRGPTPLLRRRRVREDVIESSAVAGEGMSAELAKPQAASGSR